jgi:predicted DNA-binding transcriptional regulator AlpA
LPAPAPNLFPVLLPRREVLRRIGLGNTTLWQMTKAGHFPQPVILNPHVRFPRLAWREDEVSQWINSRQKGIGAGPPGAVYERRSARAAERLTARGVPDQNTPSRLRNVPEPAPPHAAQAPSATARPRLLPVAERRAQAK